MSNFQDHPLQKIVDDQNIKIQTYKAKLRDVVQAYKELNSEKCALESSMSALLGGQSATVDTNNEALADESSRDESAQNIDESKKKVITLTESLVSIASQKNKLESTYIAEKKLLKQEFEEQITSYQEEILDLKQHIASLTNELESHNKRIIQLQQEHDNDSKNHVVILRELQMLVNTERSAKVNVETQLEEILLQAEEKNNKLQNEMDLLKNGEAKLKTQIQNLTRISKDNLILLDDSQNQVDFLKKELIKAQQLEATNRNERHENLYEKVSHLTESNKISEQRVSDLEREVTLLSMAAGEAQRDKVVNLNSIQTLKDKCVQLQQENLQLSSLISVQCKTSPDDFDIPKLIEEIRSHLDRLKAKNYDLNLINDSIDSLSNLHTKCYEKYDQLNEEFEKYKLRAQSVLKNKTKDSTQSSEREMQSLHSQVAEYKERSTTLHKLLEEKDTEMRSKELIMKSTAEATTLKLQKDIEKLHASHSMVVREFENQLRLMRERTIAMLVEKDEEIDQLKAMTCSHNHIDATDGFMTDETSISTIGSSELVSELLNARQHSTSPEAPLLHYAEEKGRLDLELSNIKKQRQQLQSEVRELQRNHVLKEDELTQKIENLEEKLRKINRDARREDANLEYLKNVILRYVSNDSDSAGRKRMLNAIATVLQFSPNERQLVFNKDKKNWWN